MQTPPWILGAIFLTISPCLADDVKEHLVTVQRYSPRVSIGMKLKARYATGICINDKCSVVATVYHAQIGVGRGNFGIVGGRTVRNVLSLANESDANKADVPVLNETLNYDIAEDISFVYTTRTVAHKSGIPYSYQASLGQRVQIAGFTKDGFELKGSPHHWHRCSGGDGQSQNSGQLNCGCAGLSGNERQCGT